MTTNPVVSSVGTAFVQRVAEQKDHVTPAALKEQFASFSAGLDGKLAEPFARFVDGELRKQPGTAWMADVLGTAQAADAAPTRDLRGELAPALQGIKANNDMLHDKSRRHGVYVGFVHDGKGIELNQVPAHLEQGHTLTAVATEYKKLKGGGWALAGLMLIGGAVPLIDGVEMSWWKQVQRADVRSPADLARFWSDAQLV